MIMMGMGKGNVLKSGAIVPIQRNGKISNVADVMISSYKQKKTSTGLGMSSWEKVAYSRSSKW